MPTNDSRPGLRRVFIRDMRLMAGIGLYPHERYRRQPVIVNIELLVREAPEPPRHLADVVCYGQLAEAIRGIVQAGHIELVETLAERIAAAALSDGRVERCRVRVEKPEAVPEAAAVGIEITRTRPDSVS